MPAVVPQKAAEYFPLMCHQYWSAEVNQPDTDFHSSACRRLWLFGHVARSDAKINHTTCTVLSIKPPETSSQLTQMDMDANIEKDLSALSIGPHTARRWAQDLEQWKRLCSNMGPALDDDESWCNPRCTELMLCTKYYWPLLLDTVHILNTAKIACCQLSSELSVDRMLRFAPNFDLRKPTAPPVLPTAGKLVTFFSWNLILGSLATVRVFTSQLLESCGSCRSTSGCSLSTSHNLNKLISNSILSI